MPRTLLGLLAGLLAVTPGAAPAADFIWTGGAGSAGPSWTNQFNYTIIGPSFGQIPAANDTVRFNNQSVQNLATTLDQNFSIRGLFIENPAGAVSIAPGAASGSTLTLGVAGLDMSAATQNLTVTAGLVAGADQIWAVGTATATRTLTLSGPVTTGGVARAITLNEAAGSTGTLGTVVLANAGNAFAAGSSMTQRNGLLRLDTPNALAGLSSGLTLSPFAATGGPATQFATTNFNAAGTFATIPLALNSSSPALRSRVQATSPGTVAFNGSVQLGGAGTTGVVELNTLGGAASQFNLGGVVFGGYTGTLQLGGDGGTGRLNNIVSLSAASGTLRKVGSQSVWELGAANAAGNWSATDVRAGTLRTTVGGALADNATLTLGQPNAVAAERLGTLDLNGTDQTVGGLATGSSDAEVNPAGNVVGINPALPGPAVASTLTYLRTGSAQTFAGTLVNAIGGGGGRTLSLAVAQGSLTLGSANTYTGGTSIGVVGSATPATLGLATVTGGSFTNNGSIAASTLISLNSTAATLSTVGLAGGANYDPASGRFLLAAGQLLQGAGSVQTNLTGVLVPAGAAVRGGLPGDVANPLTVAGGLLTLQGGTPGTAGGQLVADLNNTGTSGDTVGRVAVTAGGAVNFDVAGGPVAIRLVNAGGLTEFTPYQFVVATAAGGFQRNGSAVTSYAFGPTGDFVLSGDGATANGFTGVPTLTVSGSDLLLSFTPVPEPATVLLTAAAGLAGVRLVRRRILAG